MFGSQHSSDQQKGLRGGDRFPALLQHQTSAEDVDNPSPLYTQVQHRLLIDAINIKWTVPQLSVIIIYNSAWSILIQWLRFILSGDNLT